MRDTNPAENADAEGMPELEDRPPGISVETEQEGEMLPRDHPVAAGGDPAYATTQAEERLHESVAERAARENPDFGADERVGGSFQGTRAIGGDALGAEDVYEDQTALPSDPGMALSAEESAVHVRSDDEF